jgi:hypothetical protein
MILCGQKENNIIDLLKTRADARAQTSTHTYTHARTHARTHKESRAWWGWRLGGGRRGVAGGKE